MTGDRLKKIKTLLQDREPFYLEVSDKSIKVDGMAIKEIVSVISKFLDEECEN